MILDSLILQTKLLLQEDMKLKILEVEIIRTNYNILLLKEFTSMIGVGGKINLMTVISFDEKLLNKLVSIFMDEEEVSLDEIDEVRESVTGEVINTIIGLALPTFPNRGKGITITPPITINDASVLKKHKNSKIVSANVTTNFGSVSISAIGESEFIK
ncbi:MAG: chemotaxis protein CheX [Candidatus Altimarinota bacterium]